MDNVPVPRHVPIGELSGLFKQAAALLLRAPLTTFAWLLVALPTCTAVSYGTLYAHGIFISGIRTFFGALLVALACRMARHADLSTKPDSIREEADYVLLANLSAATYYAIGWSFLAFIATALFDNDAPELDRAISRGVSQCFIFIAMVFAPSSSFLHPGLAAIFGRIGYVAAGDLTEKAWSINKRLVLALALPALLLNMTVLLQQAESPALRVAIAMGQAVFVYYECCFIYVLARAIFTSRTANKPVQAAVGAKMAAAAA